MINQTNTEQITRRVSLIGNGAHIFVPKEWLGEEIILLREKKRPLDERVLEVLKPYLDKIIGAYLYGSQVRGEAIESSDVDLFLITSEKIEIKRKGFEIISVEEEKLEKVIKVAPLVFYSMLKEAKPIINSQLLNQLKTRYHPKKSDFKEFFASTKRMIKINEYSLEIDKEDGEYTDDSPSCYSIILRLRGVYIFKSLFSGKLYYHDEFFKWVKENTNINNADFKDIYSAYFNIKIEKKEKTRVKIVSLENLLNFLKKELSNIQYEKKKKTRKRD